MQAPVICQRCNQTFLVTKGRELHRKYCSRECFFGNPLDNLMRQVVKSENGCWNFTGSERGPGYGQFKIRSRLYCAHQASWILHRGPIPEGMLVLHKCIGNRRCVNPDHLKIGTHQENSDDMVAQGRQHDQSGSKNHQSILDEQKVRAMRSMAYFRGMYVHFAKLYGVESSVIRRAILGQTWTHVK